MVAWNTAGERTRLHTVLLLSSETMALMSDAVVSVLADCSTIIAARVTDRGSTPRSAVLWDITAFPSAAILCQNTGEGHRRADRHGCVARVVSPTPRQQHDRA